MQTSTQLKLSLCAALASFLSQAVAHAQPQTLSRSEQALQQASAAGQFTYLLFYKDVDPATQTLAGAVQQCIAAHPNQAVGVNVPVGDATEHALVTKYGVARAPLPMVIAVGPNGATTGVFRKDATAAALGNGFVAPTMLQCMKHLQDGKLVFVNVHSTPEPQTPASVALFAGSPEFQNRTAFVSMSANDTREAVLMGQMQVQPASINGTTSVLIAPPGVLIGQFTSTSTPEQIGQAVHKAGQCCNDPNCKHNH